DVAKVSTISFSANPINIRKNYKKVFQSHGRLKQEIQLDQCKNQGSLKGVTNYRITLQYKFKCTTLRNTSTDKLNQSMFSFPVILSRYHKCSNFYLYLTNILQKTDS